MQLFDFSSHGFRNLSPDPVSFGTGVTLVTGENAQGKTNLLEAVALLCGQRSFRGAAPRDMAGDGEKFAIEAEVHGRFGAERVGMTWSRANGRGFTRAGKASGFREISQLAPAVFLSPEHRDLVMGPPAVRRRFLDRLVVGVKPVAGDDLATYGAALSERNALLARLRHGSEAGADELEAWTEELAVAGAAVRRHRRAALGAWERDFRDLALEAGGDYADIRVEYSGGGDSAEELRRAFRKLLPLERRRGCSLAGPHRDDVLWRRRGRPLSAEASTGEVARVAALSRLAEWRAVAREAEVAPLFGADDFDAGLTEARAEEFFEALPREAAVVLTTASPASRWSRRAAAVLEVRGGTASAPRVLRAVEGSMGVR